ncbi:hypothetical protein F4820DRAFT_446024 [Hypoxylon rubiginosum]|uniref:Uncharacterized protein n=1 Tax=Hypoxylon rubiginosum TaxID=110542 RepID=A0ACB9Z8B5_9PEZI|nr:hypothetical protein F4820DRAFT_446024 [Hypoxylon rubiginosum]
MDKGQSPVPGNLTLCIPDGDPQENCFGVSWFAAVAISYIFQNLLTTGFSMENVSVGLGPELLQNQASFTGNGFYPNAFSSVRSRHDRDVTRKFAALAESISDEVRRTGISPNNKTRPVMIGRTVTRYDMQWQWMILHAVTVLLSIVFLATTVVQSRKAKIPSWKSNTLPVMTRGHHVDDILRGAHTSKTMEERARKSKVKLGIVENSEGEEDDNEGRPDGDEPQTIPLGNIPSTVV